MELPPPCQRQQVRSYPTRKGLSINNLSNLAPGFGPDLDGTIEEKPRHSLDYVKVFSIEARSKMARRWDARWEGYLLTGPKWDSRPFCAVARHAVGATWGD